jgi:pimeloyl-ACP methyl ester carboxylesterase
VKGLLAALVGAAVALYLTICLLFYQGQWQFVFAPPKLGAPPNMSHIAAASGIAMQDVKFDYTEEGVAHLDGWWVPAPAEGPSGLTSQMTSHFVVLYCPNGRTTLPDDVAALRAFHALGVAVFAFDYRGFGQSQPGHPSQGKAYADGLAALRYLTQTRHIDQKNIVVYGAGVGAAVAVHVAQQAPAIAALVLEDPRPSFVKLVKRQQHIHVLPLWLIFPDRFDIAPAMAELKVPKLFLVTPGNDEAAQLYRLAAGPKRLAVATASNAAGLYSQTVWQRAMQDLLTGLTTPAR